MKEQRPNTTWAYAILTDCSEFASSNRAAGSVSSLSLIKSVTYERGCRYSPAITRPNPSQNRGYRFLLTCAIIVVESGLILSDTLIV